MIGKNVSKNDTTYISFIQVVCMFAVVTLHTNGAFWRFSFDKYWISANIVECIFYFAVPVFFMLSGINLIDFPNRYNLKTYFKKRAIKVLIPYLFWSLFWIMYKAFPFQISSLSFTGITNDILLAKTSAVYWFFLPLICIYLEMPFLAFLRYEARITLFLYALLIGFFILIFIPFCINISGCNINWPLSADNRCGYILYVIGGILLHEIEFSKKTYVLILTFGIGGLFAHIIGTQILSFRDSAINLTFKGYLNIPCFFYSFASFCILKKAGSIIMRNKRIKTIIEVIAKYSFSIYLLHIFVIENYLPLLNWDDTSLIYRLGTPLLVVPITMILICFMRMIPILKYFVP